MICFDCGMETRKKRFRMVDSETESSSESDIEWSLESKRQDGSKLSSASSSAKKKEKNKMKKEKGKAKESAVEIKEEELVAPPLKRTKRQMDSGCFFNIVSLCS